MAARWQAQASTQCCTLTPSVFSDDPQVVDPTHRMCGTEWLRVARGEPQPAEPRTAELPLSVEPTSVRRARDFTRTTLANWNLDRLADDTAAIVSELVTNAFTHATLHPHAEHTRLQVALFGHPGRLVIVVTDPCAGGSTPASAEENGDYGESGRGLFIVEALSHDWGWTPLTTGGKAVWAALEH